jgi:formylglycine-generating enzyme required for sulfatase activity
MINKLISYALLAMVLAGLFYYFNKTNGNATGHKPLARNATGPPGFVVLNRSDKVDEIIQEKLNQVRSALGRKDIRNAAGMLEELKAQLTEIANKPGSNEDKRFASQGVRSADSAMGPLRDILAGHCDLLPSTLDFILANADHSRPFLQFFNYLKEYKCSRGPTRTTVATTRTTTSTTGATTPTTRTTIPPSRGDGPRLVGLRFVKIKSGSYAFGTPPMAYRMGQLDVSIRNYRVNKPFFMSTTEVTQRTYFHYVGGANNLEPRGDDLPVHSVTWQEADAFCKKLTAASSGFVFRLPNEAEWEIACRAGEHPDQGPVNTDNPRLFENPTRARQNIQRFAYMGGNNSLMTSKPERVAQMQPNSWGLFDMHGNVAEWCNKLIGEPGYNPGLIKKPVRGGSFNSTYERCRAFSRALEVDNKGVSSLGFRIVAVAR